MRKFGVRGLIAAAGIVCCYAVGYLFYQHPIPAGILSMFGLLAVPMFERYMKDRRNRALIGQFRQFLYALSTSLSAGRSVKNAFMAAEQDLTILLASDKCEMVRALGQINGKVANGQSPELAFSIFSEQTNIADIRQFAEVFMISRQAGGDIVELIRKTANLIAEKIEIELDIHVMTAQKSFEAKALMIVPFVMIGFLALGSPDYMAPLYEGAGRIIMTAVLLILVLGMVWIRHIMRIEV
jgi:tight adherence protein B